MLLELNFCIAFELDVYITFLRIYAFYDFS